MSSQRRALSLRGGALAAASASLLLTGAVVFAPSALAGTSTPNVTCVLPAGQGSSTGTQSMSVDITPADTAPGATVTATVTLGTSPSLSTQTLSNVPTTPSITLAMSGGATGDVTVTGATTNINVTSGQPVQLPTFTGSFLIPSTANGAINFTPVSNTTVTTVLGSNYSTTCTVNSGATSVATVNAQGAGAAQPLLTAPTGIVRPGASMTIGGTGWPASGTATPSLCNSTGGACDPTEISANTLSIDANGVLSGTATVYAYNIADGSYVLQVASGTSIAQTPITIQNFVPSGAPNMTIDRSSGPIGTTVNISGSNLPANEPIRLQAVNAAGNPVAGSKNYQSDPYGNLAASPYAVTVGTTAGIKVTPYPGSGDPTVTLPFTIVAVPPTFSVPAAETHDGGVVAVTGSNFTGVPTAALCDATGANCSASGISATSLTETAGNLTGSVTISSTASYGNHVIQLTDPSGQTANSAVVYVNQRWIEISSNPIAPWTTLTVKTHGFDSLLWVSYAGYDANGNRTSDLQSGSWSDINGNASGLLLVTDPSTTTIKAWVTIYPGKTAYLPVTMS